MKRNFTIPRPATCSVDGCDKPRRAKGLCMAHYHRLRAYGDPLDGGTMQGAPQRYFDEVVLTYEGDKCLPWPFSRDQNGYGQLGDKRVHRLVCERKNGPPPTPDHQAAHSCGHGHLACCTQGHLAWKTRAENEADKLIHGTALRGEKQWMARLTEADVHRIRFLANERVPQHAIAAEFNVTTSTVSCIHRGTKWGWLPSRTEG